VSEAVNEPKQRRLVRIAKRHVDELQNGRRQLLGIGERQVDGVLLDDGRDDRHLLERLDAALCHAGALGVVAELVDELLNVRSLHLLRVEGLLHHADLLGCHLLERVVVALVVREVLVVQMDNVGRDAVQELALMRYDQQGRRPALQESFEPDDGMKVQVVGGLILHHHHHDHEDDKEQCHSDLMR